MEWRDISSNVTNQTDASFGEEDYKYNPEEDSTTLIAYLPKPFALLSMICSYVLIREVLTDQRASRGGGGPIPRMLFSMAVADIFFSFGYFLGNWPAPPESYYSAIGNDGVGSQGFCTFQGFCIQLGYVASLLSNTVLSLYFLLVVRYNWSIYALEKKVEPCAQAMVWLVALGWAIVPIPMDLYNFHMEVCWINSIPTECTGEDCLRGSDTNAIFLVLLLFHILCTGVAMSALISIFVRVRHIENQAKKYATTLNISRVSTGTPSNLSESAQISSVSRNKSIAVGKQAVFYALAFLATFSWVLISTVVCLASEKNFYVLDLIAFGVLVPSAGTCNYVVFARPRTEMKTPEGRVVRAIMFCSCFWGNSNKKGAANSSSKRPTPGHSLAQEQHQTQQQHALDGEEEKLEEENYG